jgi:hypothetical protein
LGMTCRMPLKSVWKKAGGVGQSMRQFRRKSVHEGQAWLLTLAGDALSSKNYGDVGENATCRGLQGRAFKIQFSIRLVGSDSLWSNSEKLSVSVSVSGSYSDFRFQISDCRLKKPRCLVYPSQRDKDTHGAKFIVLTRKGRLSKWRRKTLTYT